MSLPKLRRLKECPICVAHGEKHVDGCGLGEFAILCWRIKSDRQAQSGAYIHPLEGAEGVPIRRFHAPDPIADIERRHAVYSAFLESLTLSGKHADQLSERRGLSAETILQNQFASVPDRFTAFQAFQIVEQLSKDYDLTHVPGFFFNVRDRWQLRLYTLDGFYIPLRDPKGRIQALQIRQDTDDKKRRYIMHSTPSAEFRYGASSGAPIHYAHPERSGPAIITEGGLKSIVCGEYATVRDESGNRIKLPCIGLLSVGSFPDIPNDLRSIEWLLREPPLRLTGTWIAYDADQRSNSHVRMQAARLGKCLVRSGFTPRLITWAGENGLDDHLLAGNSI